MITIVDYGSGNLLSIKNMLRRLGMEVLISSDATIISKSDKLILPGVGSFDYGMAQLHKSGLVEVLTEMVLYKQIPILGICLGVQLFTEFSEEGVEEGLGWIKGKTVGFNKMNLNSNQKIPHMGWTNVYNYQKSKLFTGMYDNPSFYFVHSFHLCLENVEDEMLNSNYGYTFCAGIEHNNILGVQFHPEKSHKYGMKIFENFLKYY